MEVSDGSGADLRRRDGVHRRADVSDSLRQQRKLLSLVNHDDIVFNGVVEVGHIDHVERSTVGRCETGRLHVLAAPGERCRLIDLEFDSAPNDPAPQDVVLEIARKQDAVVKDRLPG
jgi:hypothetical protein